MSLQLFLSHSMLTSLDSISPCSSQTYLISASSKGSPTTFKMPLSLTNCSKTELYISQQRITLNFMTISPLAEDGGPLSLLQIATMSSFVRFRATKMRSEVVGSLSLFTKRLMKAKALSMLVYVTISSVKPMFRSFEAYVLIAYGSESMHTTIFDSLMIGCLDLFAESWAPMSTYL